MSAIFSTAPSTLATLDKHPKGLYVLFATEMWERFSYYSMLAMFTLYLRDTTGQGFSWTVDQATGLYSNYLMFVYLSPLIGGWLADRKLGYRKAVMIGGFFFMAGHLLLSFRSIPVVYAALTCLVIGNGLFKPNVSTIVGNLYPEGSHLKDRAYNIFYMGINVGACAAPIVAEFVQRKFGFHPAFAVAAGGMAISVFILWKWKSHIESGERERSALREPRQVADTAAVAADAPPAGVSGQDARHRQHGIGPGMETDRRAHRDLPDRDRFLDGLPSAGLDHHLLGEREHRLAGQRHHLKRDQSRLGHHSHFPARRDVALARPAQPRAVHAAQDGLRHGADRRVVLHSVSRGALR